jgi:Zn-dependent protease with chaperone function
MMTREEFDRLVRCVEQTVRHHPRSLRFRVAWLALAGYAGLLAWLAAVVALAAPFFVGAFFAGLGGAILLGIFGGVVLLGGGWAVLRVLWVRLAPPQGREVSRTEAPALHALLDDLRAKLRSAHFHRVLVVADCNAAVVQVPRLGVLGWSRNYLLIGLPLLEGLSTDELRAVLAHEFAHLSKQHGRFSRWIYRLRRSWEQVFQQLARPRIQGEVSLRPLIVRFIEWFWPRFNAHAFVLSRSNEYEADALAARLAGSENIASSLRRIDLYDRRLNQKFWPDLWQLANAAAAPPEGVFLRLRDSLRTGPAPEDGARWAEQAFRFTTSNADTHPCLTDRLLALDRLPDGVVQGRFPAPLLAPHPGAAEAMLGVSLPKIRTDVEQEWRKGCAAQWRNRHARAAALHHRLASIDQAVSDSATDVDGLWDKAHVLLDLKGDQSAEPLLRQILSLQPKHVAANFHLGCRLLETDNDAGEAHLECAMAEAEELVPQACELLERYYRRTGRTDRVRDLAARLDRYERNLAASHVERRSVSANDPLVPHGLSETELAALFEVLRAEPDLASAELARKELRHFPSQKLFLLCVRVRPVWHRLPTPDRRQALVRRLSHAVRLPGRLLVFPSSGSFRPLARKLRKMPDARIFPRLQGSPVGKEFAPIAGAEQHEKFEMLSDALRNGNH